MPNLITAPRLNLYGYGFATVAYVAEHASRIAWYAGNKECTRRWKAIYDLLVVLARVVDGGEQYRDKDGAPLFTVLPRVEP